MTYYGRAKKSKKGKLMVCPCGSSNVMRAGSVGSGLSNMAICMNRKCQRRDTVEFFQNVHSDIRGKPNAYLIFEERAKIYRKKHNIEE